MKGVLVLTGASLAAALALSATEEARDSERFTIAAVGNPDVLQERYTRWKERHEAYGRSGEFAITLNKLRGLSKFEGEASGRVQLDLDGRFIEAELTGLPEGMDVDLWLVDDHQNPGGTVLAETGDGFLRLGAFERVGELRWLETEFEGLLEDGFVLDSIVVCESGKRPEEEGLLYGSPSFFQRLYYTEQVAQLEAANKRRNTLALATIATVDVETGFPDVFDDMVALGEELFFNETFDGNGRTCGTCHPAENNFTIDPDFIAGLPADDPLFVAEFTPELDSELNGGLVFENPTLMRELGLIVANVDGFGDLQNRFVMRGVSHTLGLGVSLEDSAAPELPSQRTGWGGDGAPMGQVGKLTATGSLRDFPIGAVTQHFPLTLNREIGVDFRLPTAGELDAMEAFQLSLGRDSDPDLDDLTFIDSETENGKDLFDNGTAASTPAFFSCTVCHTNGGALRGGDNELRNTGVEEFLVNNPDNLGQLRPVDGGFGTAPNGSFPAEPVANADGSFGNRKFNLISAIEAAETAPFFHNNMASTLEDSIEFYASDEFFVADNRRIVFDEDELADVSRFLRIMNVLDNVDHQAPPYAEKGLVVLAQPVIDEPLMTRLMDLAMANCTDALDVMVEKKLHKDIDLKLPFKLLKQARGRFKRAKDPAFSATSRIKRVTQGLGKLVEVRNALLQ